MISTYKNTKLNISYQVIYLRSVLVDAKKLKGSHHADRVEAMNYKVRRRIRCCFLSCAALILLCVLTQLLTITTI